MRILRLVTLAFAAALLIAACGGDDTQPTTPNDTEGTTSTTATGGGNDTTSTAPSGGGSDERIEVDATALPADPTGVDTFTADWCSLYDVADLDAFFEGSGGLAEQEASERQCSWSVSGLPDTHYVTVGNGSFDSEIAFIQSGLDGNEKEEATYNGYTVWIKRGIEANAYIEAGDLQIRLVIHGDFDGPSGPWQETMHYIDPALDALLDNVTGRL